MQNEFYNDFQYDSCISRGICSISPRISALQTVLVLYLRLFAKYSTGFDINKETQDFILNTIAITIYNPEFNETSYLFAVERFKKVLPEIMEKSAKSNSNEDFDIEKEKATTLFNETDDIIQAIKFGEKIFNRSLEQIPAKIRDLYNIMLVITKSLSINLLDLQSFGEENKQAFLTIIKLLSLINLENEDTKTLKDEIYNATELDNKLMQQLRKAQEERYGEQYSKEVSFSTIPNKAVLVVGSNIRELETILEALKEENIDIYTHDDMMLAHTFPKFSEYKTLKGQFGQGLESCLIDFATFPGPIILTKHSLHNIENFYRGRLFTTDYTTQPKGIIKIENNDFSKVIEATEETKGFKTGKQCESVTIGYNFNDIVSEINSRINHNNYTHVFIIGLDSYSLEQQAYFEKLIKFIPSDSLILSFSYNSEKENLIHINTCFDNYSWIKFTEYIKTFGLPITVFVPKCDRNSISQMIYLSNIENIEIYLGKCTPIILNPSLLQTLQAEFSIKSLSNAKKDLDQILKDK